MQSLSQSSFESVTQNFRDKSTTNTSDQYQTTFTSTNSNGKNFD